MPFSFVPGWARCGPMWTRASVLTPAVCAICAAPSVPHCPGDSPWVFMVCWSSQHMQSMMSAFWASWVTDWQGCVSPVKTMLPAGVSKRYARESRYGWTCSAGAAVTCQLLVVRILPGVMSCGLTCGGLRGSVPPRLTWMRWLRGCEMRAFQSCAKMPWFSSRMPCVMCWVGGGPKTCRMFSLPVLWSHRQSRKQG